MADKKPAAPKADKKPAAPKQDKKAEQPKQQPKQDKKPAQQPKQEAKPAPKEERIMLSPFKKRCLLSQRRIGIVAEDVFARLSIFFLTLRPEHFITIYLIT